MEIHREFSHESTGERMLKIGPHLPKLLSNIKGANFFGTQCLAIVMWTNEIKNNYYNACNYTLLWLVYRGGTSRVLRFFAFLPLYRSQVALSITTILPVEYNSRNNRSHMTFDRSNWLRTLYMPYFCRAMLCKRGLCRHAVSVCLSVCHVRTFCQNE